MTSYSTISELPLELIKEILYKTPAESLVRAKSTCKEWNSLINDKEFIYEHLDRSKSKERFLRIDQMVQIMDLVNKTRPETPFPHEFQLDLILRVKSLVHCDGLMLCVLSETEFPFSKLALWNPVTRNINLVEPSPSQRGFCPFDTYGIGYVINNNPRRDYKILKFPIVDFLGQVEIYECKSKTWKTLDDVATVVRYVHPHHEGVSVKGNMYLLGSKTSINYIFSFDFSVEKFKEICPCPCDAPSSPYVDNYLGCFKGDSLSLLQQNQNNTSPIVVWVSSKLSDDGVVSLTKYFSVASPNLPSLHSGFYIPHPVFRIDHEHKRTIIWCARDPPGMILYDIGEDGVINQLETGRDQMDNYARFCGCVYVPSVVPLP